MAARLRDLSPEAAIRLWDVSYKARAARWPDFLACGVEYLDLWNPARVTSAGMMAAFGRIPGTQNPPQITSEEFSRLRAVAANEA